LPAGQLQRHLDLEQGGRPGDATDVPDLGERRFRERPQLPQSTRRTQGQCGHVEGTGEALLEHEVIATRGELLEQRICVSGSGDVPEVQRRPEQAVTPAHA